MQGKELYNLFKQYPLICTDTRKVQKRSLFFALKGENFNGNEFAQKAIEMGCEYAIIDEKKYQINENFILVDDVLESLQELAKIHREKINTKIIGITGTNGKTTSKELLFEVIAKKYKTIATKGNLNNHIGVPITLLTISEETEFAIIEMGANHIGEIEKLCEIAQPNFGIITNIGKAHLEGFGSLKGVIEAKTEIYKFIKKNKGLVFVNSEDILLKEEVRDLKSISYGRSGLVNGLQSPEGRFISLSIDNTIVRSQLIGDYHFYNIMLAICVGKHLNISIRDIKSAIENYTPKNNRSQIIKTKKNNTLILDAYNANPSSMNAMLSSFAKQETKNKICILGDMLELGSYSKDEHQKVVNLCIDLKLNCIYIGVLFQETNSKTSFKDTEQLKRYLHINPIRNHTVLLKGSRKIKLEELVTVL